jgi:signal transduction histidine kinase
MSLRPTIHLRLTAWFAALVLVGGAVLLGVGYLLAAHQIDAYPNQVNALTEQFGIAPRSPGNRGEGRPGDLPTRDELAAQSGARRTAEQQAGGTSKRSLFVELAALLAVFAAVAVGIGLLVTRRTLAPVAAITEAARRVAAGSLGERLRLTGPDDELKQLGDTFDEMLDRVEGALARERTFIANASHELRTPLAVIQAEIDAARSGAQATDPATARSLEVIEAAIARSGRLLESLFALARAGRASWPWAPVDLTELVESALDDRCSAIAERGLAPHTTLGHAQVSGDPTLLAQLVENLIDNAIAYNRPGGELAVVVATGEGWATLAVENDGPELNDADIARLTEPFARGAQGAAPDQPGLGLGLALVDSIATAHSGSIELAARLAGGMRAVVRLPGTKSVPEGYDDEPAASIASATSM